MRLCSITVRYPFRPCGVPWIDLPNAVWLLPALAVMPGHNMSRRSGSLRLGIKVTRDGRGSDCGIAVATCSCPCVVQQSISAYGVKIQYRFPQHGLHLPVAGLDSSRPRLAPAAGSHRSWSMAVSARNRVHGWCSGAPALPGGRHLRRAGDSTKPEVPGACGDRTPS